jgi:hypothetical protein
MIYCTKKNTYWLPLPKVRETNYPSFGLQVDATALRFGGAGRAELWGDTRSHQLDRPTACKHWTEHQSGKSKKNLAYSQRQRTGSWGMGFSLDRNKNNIQI